MKKVQYIFILMSVIFSHPTFGQDGTYVTVRDFETWSSVGAKYKVKHNWSFELNQQLRLKENSSEIDAYFTELGTTIDFNERVYGAIGYRFIRKNDNTGNIQGYENHMRLQFDLGYKQKIERFNIDYRLRYQTKNEIGISSDDGDVAKNNLRLKAGINYNFKKWKLDPEISSEIFRSYEQGEQTEFNKFRLTLGTKYKIKNFGKLGAFYRMEKELNTSYPKTTNIIGIKYNYTFKADYKKPAKKKEESKEWY